MITDFENEVTNLVENFVDVPIQYLFIKAGLEMKRPAKKVPTRVETKGATVT